MARKPIKTYRFTAPLEKMNAQMGFMYVEVPIDVEKEFGTRSRVRVQGTVNGVAVDRALMPNRDILAVMARTSFKNERGDREGETTQVGGSQLCGLTRAVGSLR